MSHVQKLSQVTAVLGAQWGDEGKGKLVDVLARRYDIIGRFNGGSNAGHTIVVGDKKYAFHLVPSAVLHPKCECLLGNGVVVNLESLATELEELDKGSIDYRGRFFISDRAHLLFGFHKIVDGLREGTLQKTGADIGTTKQGIGPCYASKANRLGVRVADLVEFDEVFVPRFSSLFAATCREFGPENFSTVNPDQEIEKYRAIAQKVKPMIVDGVVYINKALKEGKNILIEGANAIMLDIDFGTYPFVTSSNPSAGGATTGLGIPPQYLTNAVGIVKAYTTRVGSGPFLSEELGEDGLKLQTLGFEVGTTTGRKRRCGWIDIVQLKYSAMINGFLQISLTKLDVLDKFEKIHIVTAYVHNGVDLESYPASLRVLEQCVPKIQTVSGWNSDISKAKKYSELPENARKYIELIESFVGVPITSIGVGPKRDHIVFRKCQDLSKK